MLTEASTKYESGEPVSNYVSTWANMATDDDDDDGDDDDDDDYYKCDLCLNGYLSKRKKYTMMCTRQHNIYLRSHRLSQSNNRHTRVQPSHM